MTQTADPVRIAEMLRCGALMRTGRKLGRTLYLATPDDDYGTDLCVGIVDSPDLAGDIVRIWNLAQIAKERERRLHHDH